MAIKGLFWGIVFSTPIWAVIVIIALFFIAPAKADPAQEHDAALVCKMIDAESVTDSDSTWITDQGIANVVMTMYNQGLSAEVATDTIRLAISKYCPEWRDAVLEFFTEFQSGEFTINNNGTVIYNSQAQHII